MTQQTLKAVFFDLDGTLLDTAPDFVNTLNVLAIEYNITPVTEDQVRQTVSHGARALTTLLFAVNETDDRFETYRQRLLTVYGEQMGKHCQLFPGIEALLINLEQQQLHWGIITNKPWQFTEDLVKQLHLPSTPAVVIAPEHVKRAKPDPEALLLACDTVGCLPQETIYIGDHKRDIDCGIGAGSETIAVNFGYIHDDDDIYQWQAHHIAQQPQDIWPIIQQRLQTS